MLGQCSTQSSSLQRSRGRGTAWPTAAHNSLNGLSSIRGSLRRSLEQAVEGARGSASMSGTAAPPALTSRPLCRRCPWPLAARATAESSQPDGAGQGSANGDRRPAGRRRIVDAQQDAVFSEVARLAAQTGGEPAEEASSGPLVQATGAGGADPAQSASRTAAAAAAETVPSGTASNSAGPDAPAQPSVTAAPVGVEEASQRAAADGIPSWDDFRADVQRDLQRVQERWRTAVTDPFSEPSQSPGQLAASGAVGDADAELRADVAGRVLILESPTGGSVALLRRTAATRALQLLISGVFVAQWRPALVALHSAGGVGGAEAHLSALEVVLAVLLACPPTSTTLNWQAVRARHGLGGRAPAGRNRGAGLSGLRGTLSPTWAPGHE
jgi:hypothetical protein